jgi:hypothetical protein
VGGFASQLPSRGGSFAMNRPPADVFGQALLEDSPQWAELHVVANRREYGESVGLEVGPWEPAAVEGKIKRTGVRKFADLHRSRNLCLHIGF